MGETKRTEHISLVRTTCERCGTIEVPLGNVVLRIDESSAMGICIVRCPTCATRCSQPACDTMMTALVAVGVEISLVVPQRAFAAGSELTSEEIDRFVSSLECEDDLLSFIYSDDTPPDWR